MEGRFGNYHATSRTGGSELFINSLMSLYWGFQLDAVAKRNMNLDVIGETESFTDIWAALAKFRTGLVTREWVSLPM